MLRAKLPYTLNAPTAPTLTEPLADIEVPNGVFLPGIDDSNTYALKLLGRTLEPVATEGEHALISPTRASEPGDFVALLFHDERGPLVLRLVMPSPVPAGEAIPATSNALPLILVETLTPRRLLQFRTDKLRAVHRVIGFLKADGTMAELPKFDRARRAS